jgi:plasmid stabilization system protein ParE
MKVHYREAALVDLAKISSYLENRSPSGARNVLRAIHSAIDLISENPFSGRPSIDPAMRVKVVDRYGYKIFYTTSTDTIEILHIRHGARRPWPPEVPT